MYVQTSRSSLLISDREIELLWKQSSSFSASSMPNVDAFCSVDSMTKRHECVLFSTKNERLWLSRRLFVAVCDARFWLGLLLDASFKAPKNTLMKHRLGLPCFHVTSEKAKKNKEKGRAEKPHCRGFGKTQRCKA